jgi:hypothetical protein
LVVAGFRTYVLGPSSVFPYAQGVMLCTTWNKLYESYEEMALVRLQSSRIHGLHVTDTDLDSLNDAIAKALRELKNHERHHHCHS